MAIQVGLYKMDKRTESRLRTVFKMVYKKQCVISKIDDSETVIINVEDQDPKKFLAEFRKDHPGKPVIIFSDSPVEIDDLICLTQPCAMSSLLDALKQTSHFTTSKATKNCTSRTADSLRKKLVSSSDKIVPHKNQKKQKTTIQVSSSDQTNIYYNPDNFLQGKIVKAIEKANRQNKSVFLRCWSHRWILVSPATGFLLENIKENQLSDFGLVNIESDVIFKEEALAKKQMAAMSETPLKEVKSTAIDKFIWNISVRTALGRIPEGTSCDALYVLKQWPNLTRLTTIKNAMRISALWLDQPQSINNIAIQLDIPNIDVYTYFSAASAISLIVPASRKEDKIVIPEVTKVAENKRGLFLSLLHKLSGATNSLKH